jgi:hypothetical protein
MTAGQEEATGTPPAVTELVEDAAGGDSRSWECLVETYARLIWVITRELEGDAPEVTRVTWLRLPEHIDQLGSSALAREKVVLAQDDDTAGGVPAPGPGIDERLLAAGRAQGVRDALSRLPPGWQQLLEMLMAGPPASD